MAAPVLRSPLLITVVAALLGSLLLPYITRQWQDHQQALEIQTGLVSGMSESVSEAVTSGRFLASGLVRTHEQAAWNAAYRTWATRSASIGARLEAYFGPEVGAAWRQYGYVVTDYLALSARPTPHRRAQVGEIYGYDGLPRDLLKRPAWLALAGNRDTPAFQAAYGTLARALLTRRDELVRQVLDTSVTGF